jgi:phosphatidylglycerol lysyltransferase
MLHRAFSRLVDGARALLGRFSTLLWLALFVGLLVLLFIRERGQITRSVDVLRGAHLVWVLAVVALALVEAWLIGLIFRSLLGRLGHRVGAVDLSVLHLQRRALGTLSPVGGGPGLFVFLRALARRGVTAEDTILASAVSTAVGHASYGAVLVPVMILLAVEHRLSGVVLLAVGALIAAYTALAVAVMAWLRGTRLPSWLPGGVRDRILSFVARLRGHGLGLADLGRPFVYSLAVDLANVAMLYAALRAVGERPSPTAAFVGYSIGLLFSLAAPVFHGVGVVEAGMTLTLTRFGVPASAALAATLLYRVGELWLPVALGLSLQARDQPELRRASLHVPAFVTGFTGLLTSLSVLAPSLPDEVNRVGRYARLAPADASRTFVLVAGFLLLFLAYGLLRRRRVAWVAAIVLLIALVPAHLGKRHDQALAAVAAVNVGLLLLHRRQFRVRSDVPTLRRALIRLGFAGLFVFSYGTLGFWLLSRRDFGRIFTFPEAARRTLRIMLTFSESGLIPRTRYADWFLDSFAVVGVVAVALSAFSLLQPVVWRRRTLPSERARARALIARYGDSSLDHFKGAEDKLFCFAESGRAVVSFGMARSTAVVLGDPVAADQAAFQAVLAEFLDFCDANGWRAAFHQVPPDHLADYRAAGLRAIKIGEEAIVDLTTFSLQGHAMKGLRAAVNRLGREGFRAVFYAPPLAEETLHRLREVSDDWLNIPGRRERGFSLGWFDEDAVRATPVMTIEDAAGGVAAFANMIPDGVEGEATIDLMRRRRDVPNGVMDLLQVRLCEQFRAEGYRRYSLGLSPLAEVGAEPGSPAVERALRLLYEHFDRFFSYQGMRAYKAKFAPIWEPRYFVYRSDASLPLVALALVQVTERAPVARHERRRLVPWRPVGPRRVGARRPRGPDDPTPTGIDAQGSHAPLRQGA